MSDAKSINNIRKEVGMVFQRFNLFPHMTVLQNIILSPMKTRGESKEEATKTAIQLLEKVGLANKVSFSSRASNVVVCGFVFGISMIEVTPPAAAARLSVVISAL